MNHVISLINNANLTPFEFMKRVAKGEVQLVIESNIGEQLTPPKEFWQEVIKSNSDNIPTILQHHVVAPWSWESKTLIVQPTAIDVLRKTSPNDWVRIRKFLSKDTDKSSYCQLKVRDLFSNWQAEASESLEMLLTENALLKSRVDELMAEKNSTASLHELNNAQKALAAISFGLLNKSSAYNKKDKPNVSAIANMAVGAISDKKNNTPYGFGLTTINQAITDALRKHATSINDHLKAD
jgi:hypothetical protein